MFKNREFYRRLKSIGSAVDTSYLVYINNEQPATFSSKDDAYQFIRNYRKETSIFKLQLFRIETFSL